jgi:hypothetical protein
MNQRRNSPAVAKKLKIEACFPKRAKRPRFARLNEASFLTGNIFNFLHAFLLKAGTISNGALSLYKKTGRHTMSARTVINNRVQ